VEGKPQPKCIPIKKALGESTQNPHPLFIALLGGGCRFAEKRFAYDALRSNVAGQKQDLDHHRESLHEDYASISLAP